MSEIRLFMCCHKPYDTVPDGFQSIQCGSVLKQKLAGVLYDDEGDNISAKNREYCELTAHYYVWKNIQADYYGFCHYRRFFGKDNKNKAPYVAKGLLSYSGRSLLAQGEELYQLIKSHDIIAPRSEDMGIPVREHYCTSRYHYSEDLELFLALLYKKFPQVINTAERYLSQHRQFFCNMFIMDRTHFHEYCAMLFDVLEEFDTKKQLHGDFQSDRTDGYLGELFTGIYITSCMEKGSRVKLLPRIDTECSRLKRIGCALLPPESRRRFAAKALAKKLGGK